MGCSIPESSTRNSDETLVTPVRDFCPKSLSDLFGYKRGWSWSGGFIEIRPGDGKMEIAGTVTRTAPAGAERLEVNWKAPP